MIVGQQENRRSSRLSEAQGRQGPKHDHLAGSIAGGTRSAIGSKPHISPLPPPPQRAINHLMTKPSLQLKDHALSPTILCVC